MAYFQTTYVQPIRAARTGQSIVAAYQPIDGLGGEVGFPLPAWATRRTLILGALALAGVAYFAMRKGKRQVANGRGRRRHRRNGVIQWGRSGGGTGWQGEGPGGHTYLLRRAGGDKWNLHVAGRKHGPFDSLGAAKDEVERYDARTIAAAKAHSESLRRGQT